VYQTCRLYMQPRPLTGRSNVITLRILHEVMAGVKAICGHKTLGTGNPSRISARVKIPPR